MCSSDLSATRRLGIGPGDGGEIEAQSGGEIALGRQLLAGLHDAEPHIVRKRVGDGEIEGLAVRGEIGTPGHALSFMHANDIYKPYKK